MSSSPNPAIRVAARQAQPEMPRIDPATGLVSGYHGGTGPGESPQVAEPGGVLAAGGDARRPDHLVQAAERARAVSPGHAVRRTGEPRAIEGHAADGDVGPAPDDPRVSFPVPGRYPHRRRRRVDRPRTRG